MATAPALEGFRNPLAQGWAWCVEAKARNAVEWRSLDYGSPAALFQRIPVEYRGQCLLFQLSRKVCSGFWKRLPKLFLKITLFMDA